MLRHQTDASGSVTEQQALNTALPCTTKLAGQFLLDLGQRALHLPSNVVIPCYDSRQPIEVIAQNQPLDVARLAGLMDHYLTENWGALNTQDSQLTSSFEQALSLAALRSEAQVKAYACDRHMCIASLSISDSSQIAHLRNGLAQSDDKTAISRAFYWLNEPGNSNPSLGNMLIMQW